MTKKLVDMLREDLSRALGFNVLNNLTISIEEKEDILKSAGYEESGLLDRNFTKFSMYSDEKKYVVQDGIFYGYNPLSLLKSNS